ncbi:MAG: hypothetical protein WC370_07390 [Dehalococcoidales bacterium]|jgi:outer membrane lipoprotein SlyB
MVKKLLVVAVLLSLVGLLGCAAAGNTTEKPASVKIIREAEITSGWAVKQMEITLKSETQIVLILAAGDKVDGYFYCTSGDNVTFTVAGNSGIYASARAVTGVDSDRFSFVASQAQGIAYILKLNPVKTGTNKTAGATVFFDIIYPATGEISMPIGTQ